MTLSEMILTAGLVCFDLLEATSKPTAICEPSDAIALLKLGQSCRAQRLWLVFCTFTYCCKFRPWCKVQGPKEMHLEWLSVT